MNGIFLLLGSNLGDRIDHIHNSIKKLEEQHIQVLSRSSVYETEPWGKSDQPWFLNQILEVKANNTAEELLQKCLDVEVSLGRFREEKWGPRPIDIDILYYNNHVIDTDKLKIPHPGLPNRKFALIPMVELAGGLNHPVLGKSQIELLMECTDQLQVKKTKITSA